MVKFMNQRRKERPAPLDNPAVLKQTYTDPESPASATECDLLGFGDATSTALVPTNNAPEPDLLFMEGADSMALVPSTSSQSSYGGMDENLLQLGDAPSTSFHCMSLEDNEDSAAPSPADLTPLDSSKVVAEGSLWARVTRNKMVTKEWQELTWMQYGPTTLYLFKSRQDYMDWKHYTMNGGQITNEIRERLVKKRLDFAEEVKKPSVKGFSLGAIKDKTYNQVGRGSPLYNFKLECWTKLGPVTVAAFGSIVKEEAEAMHKRLKEMYTTGYNENVPNK